MILAVDDEPIILMGTVALVQSLGRKVVSASGGDDALRLIGAYPEIDVLITDLEMPKYSGVVLAHAALEQRPGLKIILATGQWHVKEEVPPSWAILLKPFGLEDLAGALSQVEGASGDGSRGSRIC